MKIYHVETQQDYDALMVELEEKGYEWLSGGKPTFEDYWESYKENTGIVIPGKYITFGPFEQLKKQHQNTPVIEYKAKGENMTQEEMKQNILDWATDTSVAVESFARDIKFEMKKSTAEADLQEAKSSAKKLIEKIDEYLESQKPKFKVGDYVVELDKYITKITEKNDDDMFKGHFFMPGNNHFSCIKDIVSSYTARHATQEEIEEYEAALTFYKNGRKPFYVKEGDLIKSRSGNKKIISFPKDFSKIDFVNGNWEFLKTAEEVNEWLENK